VFGAPGVTSFSAFLFAVRGGHMDAARALLEAGADVNDTISSGESALIVAIANGHWQLAAFLLDKGADPNQSKAGWTPLHQLMRSRRLNVGFSFPPPIQTGTLDSIDLANMLIAKGANVNARMTKDGMKDGQRNRLNRLGATPFLLASKDTDVEAMRLLLAAGADPSIPTADNDTPLMVASGVHIWNPGEDGGSLATQEDEQLEAVKLCVELGNDVNAANIFGDTPLHGAAYRGANSMIAFLIKSGARLDAKDSRGWTPLAIANGIKFDCFYKAQPETAALLEGYMKKAGLPTTNQIADGTECLDCLGTHPELARAHTERIKKQEAEFAKQQQ
jgi:ankyrin repeat protein